ncbi:hypothetical protein MMC10_001192 [Thelotrema lepadinum]|nr:hypothetical protein [Thelotrema lepadinum]
MQLQILTVLSIALSVSALAVPRAAALGSLGGAAPPVTNSGSPDRPFEVNGNTFVNQSAAQQRSCDIQNNACFNAFNAGGASFTEADCQTQQQACNSAAPTATGSSTGTASGSGAAGSSASSAPASATSSAVAASAPSATASSAAGGDDTCASN